MFYFFVDKNIACIVQPNSFSNDLNRFMPDSITRSHASLQLSSFNWTTTIELFLLTVSSLQIPCFRKTKEKQFKKLRTKNKCITVAFFLHSYIISWRDGKNNGLLAGVSLPPSLRAPRISLAPKTPFSFPFKHLPHRLGPVRKNSRFWLFYM